MNAQIGQQIVPHDLTEFFEFLGQIVEDEYYIIHYQIYPLSNLIIANSYGEFLVNIQHPEQYLVLQSLLTYLVEEGVPVMGQSELVIALSGEQILSLLG